MRVAQMAAFFFFALRPRGLVTALRLHLGHLRNTKSLDKNYEYANNEYAIWCWPAIIRISVILKFVIRIPPGAIMHYILRH